MRTVPRRALALALLAALAGCSLTLDPNSVNPPELKPTADVSATSLTWSLPQGSTAQPQTVTVSNSGKGTLAAPTTSIAYTTGSGWLTATVSGAAAPYTVSVRPNLAGLAMGRYTATVTISSVGASNPPRTVGVVLNVGSATLPTIGLSASTLAFTGLVGGTPAAQTVTVSNYGTGTLAAPTTTIAYTSGAGGWLTATPSGGSAPYTISVQASAAGLAAGNYTAELSIRSAGASNTPATVTVTFGVGSASQPTIALTPQTLTFVGIQGQPSPPAQDVTVSNPGTGALAAPVPSITYVSGGTGWLSTTVAGTAAPYTVTVRATTGSLTPGDHVAVVTISSSGASNSPVPIVVTFTVGSSSQPTLAVTPDTLTFTAQEGTAPAPQTIAVFNAGVGTLAAPTADVTYGDGGGWLSATVSAAAPYSVTVQPSAALAAGTHTATIAIASAGASSSPQTVQVTVNVGSPSQPSLAVSPASLLFTATVGGGAPPAQPVTVSNAGAGTLAAPTATVAYGDGSGWLSATVSGTAVPYSVSIRPTTVLAAGTHTATVTLTSAGASNTATVSVRFEVGSASQPTIGLSASVLQFTARVGTALPGAQPVYVTNTGTGTLAAPQTTVSYGDGAGWLSATVSGAAAPYTITVQPDPAGLGVGDHTATISVSSAGASNSPQLITVTLRLGGVTGCIVAASGHQLCGSVASAGAAPRVQAAGGHAVRVGMVQPGAQVSSAGPAASDHRIVRGTASPGSAKP